MEEDLSELLKIYGVGAAPTRKAVQAGTLGRSIQLQSNLYNVAVRAPTLYRYDVSIAKVDVSQPTAFRSSKKTMTSVKLNQRAVTQFIREGHIGECIPAYDGRSIVYLSRKLTDSKTTATVSVNLDDGSECDEFARKAQFEVTLKEVGPLSLKTFNPEVVQALDIIVRTGPLMDPGIVPVGRSFFTRKHTTMSGDSTIRGCRELWFGYFCSIRPGQWKPMLNVNLSATLFHESLPMIEYVCKFFNKTNPEELKKGLKPFEQETLKRELTGVKIKVTHLPYRRQYKVAGVSKKGASDYTFAVDGTQVSVAEYFEKHYGIQLQYPALQCVETLAKDGNKNYIPMEVCETIEGQHAKMVNPDQTAVLIRKTALSPIERFQNIDRFVKKVVNQDAASHLKEFGLQVDMKPVQVKGRLLNPPELEIGKQDVLKPRDGYWRMDNRRQFFAGAELSCWGVADCHGSKRTAEFAKNIERLGNGLGMKIKPPAFVKTYQRVPVKKMLSEIKSQFPNIVMAVIIMGRETEYETIKQLSENDETLLMLTQCIRGTSLESKKCDNNFMTNVLMKVNAKLGGTNNSLTKAPACMREPYIVFGADVSHPAAMNKVQPSIAAVVGSLDSTPSQYHTVTSFQRSSTCNRLEYIANLKVMIKDCLRAFYRRNHTKPLTLLFFRDGVSDSQFEAVRAFEILQIRMACKELQDDYEPPLTFIVVQKRHQVRFKPVNDAEGQGRHKNIPAGTVIEDTVTHPVNFDYFLCSHAGIQGTSKPAHYQVLHDDANRSADELQAISYSLCHVYGRCSRSVSIPAPVYYAHLAAARAKDHFKAADIHPSSTSDRSSGIESGSSLLQSGMRDMDLYDLKRRSSNVDARMRDYLYYV